MRSENDIKNAGREQLTLATLIEHLQGLCAPDNTPVIFDIYSKDIGWPALHEDIYIWSSNDGLRIVLGEP